jgi:hypothetical protein
MMILILTFILIVVMMSLLFLKATRALLEGMVPSLRTLLFSFLTSGPATAWEHLMLMSYFLYNLIVFQLLLLFVSVVTAA